MSSAVRRALAAAQQWLHAALSQWESGQGLVEYALLLPLVSIAALVALALLGVDLVRLFTSITRLVGNAIQTA